MDKPLVYTLLQKLVGIRTVTGDFAANNQALDMIEEFLAGRGMHIHRTAHDGYGALVATTRHTKQPRVMLVGHIDVVNGLSDGLFALREQDGKLYGRGTRDMKGAIAAYMATVDMLKDNLDEYDFGIMLISDEETQDLGVVRFLEEGWRPKSVILLDGGESWGLEKLAKGALYTSVKVRGKAAHGSRPWLGDSASFKLVRLLAELQKDFEGHGPETDTLNIPSIAAGSGAYNQIPAAAEAMLDIRIADSGSEAKIDKRLDELCQKYDASWERLVRFPVLKHDMSNPFIAEFEKSIAKVTGRVHETVVAYGASDASRFDALGIPCGVTYPLSGGHHSEEEWVSKEALSQLVLILTDYLGKTGKTDRVATTETLTTV